VTFFSFSTSRTPAAARSKSNSRNCGNGRGSGPTDKIMRPFEALPSRTMKAPFVTVLGSPSIGRRSIGVHADFPLPRGWPNTFTPASASQILFSRAKAVRWNTPQDLHARITTASSGTKSYWGTAASPTPPTEIDPSLLAEATAPFSEGANE